MATAGGWFDSCDPVTSSVLRELKVKYEQQSEVLLDIR